jgi:hypothetical protein
MKFYFLLTVILSEILLSYSFVNLLGSFHNVKNIKMFQMKDINERKLYGTYLIGLRKTKKILKNNTAIYSLLNLTNDYVIYYTPNKNNTIFNNIHDTNSTSNTGNAIKNIIMKNVVIDVSNVKEIQIRTENEKLILELDKQQTKDQNMVSIIGNINNIDTVINAANLFGYIMNIYKT